MPPKTHEEWGSLAWLRVKWGVAPRAGQNSPDKSDDNGEFENDKKKNQPVHTFEAPPVPVLDHPVVKLSPLILGGVVLTGGFAAGCRRQMQSYSDEDKGFRRGPRRAHNFRMDLPHDHPKRFDPHWSPQRVAIRALGLGDGGVGPLGSGDCVPSVEETSGVPGSRRGRTLRCRPPADDRH